MSAPRAMIPLVPPADSRVGPPQCGCPASRKDFSENRSGRILQWRPAIALRFPGRELQYGCPTESTHNPLPGVVREGVFVSGSSGFQQAAGVEDRVSRLESQTPEKPRTPSSKRRAVGRRVAMKNGWLRQWSLVFEAILALGVWKLELRPPAHWKQLEPTERAALRPRSCASHVPASILWPPLLPKTGATPRKNLLAKRMAVAQKLPPLRAYSSCRWERFSFFLPGQTSSSETILAAGSKFRASGCITR